MLTVGRSIGWGNRKPPVGTPLNSNDPINFGLIGCWVFNEGAGLIAKNVAGPGDGSLVNLAVPMSATSGWRPGKFGTSLALDGTNDYVLGPTSSRFSPTGDMAISCWIKTATAQSNTGIFSKWDISAQATGWLLFAFGTSQVTFQVDAAANRATAGITDLVWNHVCGVRSGTTIYLFINGVQAASKTSTTLSASTSALQIGSYGATPGQFFNGSIDNARFYNRALLSTEVWHLFRSPFAGLMPPRLRTGLMQAPATTTFAFVPFGGGNQVFPTAFVPLGSK